MRDQARSEPTGLDRLPGADQWIRAVLRFRSEHPALLTVLAVVERLQDRPVRTHALLLGEAGTGKEGLARALHALMHPDGAAPFVEVALEGMEPAEAAATLVGVGGHPGLIEQAHGGTLYVDEVAALAPVLQRHLLAATRGRFRRLDERAERTVSTCVVAATAQEPGAAVREGRLRHDLHWRLARIVLTLPPLRERRADLGALAIWIGNRVLHRLGGGEQHLAFPSDEASPGAVVLTDEAVAALGDHPWPGNLRELDAVLERALALYHREGEALTAAHIRAALTMSPRAL